MPFKLAGGKKECNYISDKLNEKGLPTGSPFLNIIL